MRADGLVKRYGARTALGGVSFEAAAGEIVAIIGPNGAGKTTLLSILGGLIDATEGSIDTPPGQVGWVPQHAAVYRKLSVAENLTLFARLEGLEDADQTVTRLLDTIGLADRAGDELGSLSGGNQQRVNIAIGLLADPPVLLLDEPSSSLDPRQRAVLWEFVSGLARERQTTVVFSTHNVGEAERYADRVLVLADGELVFGGSPSELQTTVGDGHADFESAFVAFLHGQGH